MNRGSLFHILSALFIALTISAILAPLAAALLDGLIIRDICGLGTSAVRVTSPLHPETNGLIMCVDAAGHLHSVSDLMTWKWLVFFAPLTLLLFVLFYRAPWLASRFKAGK